MLFLGLCHLGLSESGFLAALDDGTPVRNSRKRSRRRWLWKFHRSVLGEHHGQWRGGGSRPWRQTDVQSSKTRMLPDWSGSSSSDAHLAWAMWGSRKRFRTMKGYLGVWAVIIIGCENEGRSHHGGRWRRRRRRRNDSVTSISTRRGF